MSSTLTQEQEAKITEWLAAHPTLTEGVGTKEAACSVAAWNLALTGTLTDEIPDCASEVVGRWIIVVQDSCPPEHGRGHPEWLRLLPLAAGTGRAHDAERMAIVLDWMWSTVLPSLQLIADQQGFGEKWRVMCETRTSAAAHAAKAAAWEAGHAADAAADAAKYAAESAAAHAAAHAAEKAGHAARYARYAGHAAADAALCATRVICLDAWAAFAPVEVLRKLIAVTDARAVA